MLLKLNLQKFAVVKYAIKINYDSNVTSVVDNDGRVFTTSGETKYYDVNTTYTFTVEMTQGYELDSVTSDKGNISNVSGNSFQVIHSYDTTVNITITTKKATSQVSIDLTTLSGWGNVADRQHQLTVQAKADNYRDSEKSTAVSFTKTPPLVTIPAGTYHFTDEYITDFDDSTVTDFSYKSNNVNYTKLYRGFDTSNHRAIGFNYYPNDNGMVGWISGESWGNHSFEDGAWKSVTINNAIQTIVVETDQHVPQEFYDWFMANTLSGTLKETWLLNSTINFPASGYNSSGILDYNIKFVAKNRNFVVISFWKYVISSTNTLTNMYYNDGDETNTQGNVTVYTADKKWYNQGIGDVYRTIQLYETPTGALLTWLQANGVKQ